MWIDGHLQSCQVAIDEVVEAGRRARRAETGDGILKRPERAVIANVYVETAEAELVIAARPVQIFISLYEVLRAAKGNGAARRERQVSRQSHAGAFQRQHDVGAEEEGRHRRLIRVERLQVVQAIEDQLALRHQRRREGVRQVQQEVVVEVCRAGIKPCERAEGVGAGKEVLALKRIAAIELRALAVVEVDACQGLIGILRQSAANVARRDEPHFPKCRQTGRQAGKRTCADIGCGDNIANRQDTSRRNIRAQREG